MRTRNRFRMAFLVLAVAGLCDDGLLLFPTMPDCAPLRSATESSLEAYREPRFA